MGPILEEIIRATVDGDEKKTAALARRAMALPTLPSPTIPSVFSLTLAPSMYGDWPPGKIPARISSLPSMVTTAQYYGSGT